MSSDDEASMDMNSEGDSSVEHPHVYLDVPSDSDFDSGVEEVGEYGEEISTSQPTENKYKILNENKENHGTENETEDSSASEDDGFDKEIESEEEEEEEEEEKEEKESDNNDDDNNDYDNDNNENKDDLADKERNLIRKVQFQGRDLAKQFHRSLSSNQQATSHLDPQPDTQPEPQTRTEPELTTEIFRPVSVRYKPLHEVEAIPDRFHYLSTKSYFELPEDQPSTGTNRFRVVGLKRHIHEYQVDFTAYCNYCSVKFHGAHTKRDQLLHEQKRHKRKYRERVKYTRNYGSEGEH